MAIEIRPFKSDKQGPIQSLTGVSAHSKHFAISASELTIKRSLQLGQ
jgi:hypothetical protein